MSVAEVKERRDQRPRAGTHALTLLSAPINVAVLRALAQGPRSQADLRRAAGMPSQSTMRLRLRELVEPGALRQERQAGFPRAIGYELGSAGAELLVVMAVLERWLAESPTVPVELGTPLGKGTVKALVEGWSSTLIRALAARPLTLTELDRLITGLNYPSLERRLGTMRGAGQLESLPSDGPGTPYTVTRWLRRGVAPLAAAARWERLHTPELTAPIGKLDIEAAFLLSVPLVRLSPDLSGSCRLAVEAQTGGERRLTGVMATVEQGRIASSVTNLAGEADAWALGSAGAWLRAVIERDRDQLELGGDCRLAGDLVDGLNCALFG